MGPWNPVSAIQVCVPVLVRKENAGTDWFLPGSIQPPHPEIPSYGMCTQDQDDQSQWDPNLTSQGAGSQLSICSQAAVDPLPQGHHSPRDCKLLEAVSQSSLLPSMWNEVGYILLDSHPQGLVLPRDHHTSAKITGLGCWAVPLRYLASHRPGEESLAVHSLESGDTGKWRMRCSLLRLLGLWAPTSPLDTEPSPTFAWALLALPCRQVRVL